MLTGLPCAAHTTYLVASWAAAEPGLADSGSSSGPVAWGTLVVAAVAAGAAGFSVFFQRGSGEKAADAANRSADAAKQSSEAAERATEISEAALGAATAGSKREEVMRTLRWAADLAVSDDPHRAALGLAQLNALGKSALLDADGQAFIDAALQTAVQVPVRELKAAGEDPQIVGVATVAAGQEAQAMAGVVSWEALKDRPEVP